MLQVSRPRSRIPGQIHRTGPLAGNCRWRRKPQPRTSPALACRLSGPGTFLTPPQERRLDACWEGKPRHAIAETPAQHWSDLCWNVRDGPWCAPGPSRGIAVAFRRLQTRKSSRPVVSSPGDPGAAQGSAEVAPRSAKPPSSQNPRPNTRRPICMEPPATTLRPSHGQADPRSRGMFLRNISSPRDMTPDAAWPRTTPRHSHERERPRPGVWLRISTCSQSCMETAAASRAITPRLRYGCAKPQTRALPRHP